MKKWLMVGLALWATAQLIGILLAMVFFALLLSK